MTTPRPPALADTDCCLSTASGPAARDEAPGACLFDSAGAGACGEGSPKVYAQSSCVQQGHSPQCSLAQLALVSVRVAEALCVSPPPPVCRGGGSYGQAVPYLLQVKLELRCAHVRDKSVSERGRKEDTRVACALDLVALKVRAAFARCGAR